MLIMTIKQHKGLNQTQLKAEVIIYLLNKENFDQKETIKETIKAVSFVLFVKI